MKRLLITLALSAVVLINGNSFCASASDNNAAHIISRSTTYYDDGSYCVITVMEEPDLLRSNSTTGSVNCEYGDGNTIYWSYTLYATFSYDYNVSSNCTNVWDDYSIFNSSWHYDNSNCWSSVNNAYGTVTMKKKALGVTLKTESCNLQLSCDKYGHITTSA